MSNFFDYSFPVVQETQSDPGGGPGSGIEGLNVPPRKPESYFFMDPSAAQVPSDKAFGPVSSDEFQITTAFNSGGTEVKAYAVTSGTLFFAQHGNEINKVNIFLKPNKDIGLGVKVKYFVYRGIKTENIFKNVGGEKFLIEKLNVNTLDFLKPVWDDYTEFNETDQDFKAKKIGYLDENTPVDQILQMFFTKDTHSLLHVTGGMHIGNFEGNFGFEIVLDDGDFTEGKAVSGLQFNEKFANAKECILNTGTAGAAYVFGSNTNGIGEKIFRENIYHFVDPAAYYGAHITAVGANNNNGGKVKVKNGSSEDTWKKAADIFTHVVSKFKNKNKVYLYIKSTKGRSYNFYDQVAKPVLVSYSVNSVTTQLEQFHADGWPIQIFNNEADSVRITLKLTKIRNNQVYYHTGMNGGTFCKDEELVYEIEGGGHIPRYMTADIPANRASSLIFLSCSLNDDKNSFFGPLDIDTIFEEEDFTGTESRMSWGVSTRPVLAGRGKEAVLYNTKIVFDKKNPDVSKRLKTFFLTPVTSTVENDEYAEFQNPGFLSAGYTSKKISSSREFCREVLGKANASVFRGKIAGNIYSLAFRADESVNVFPNMILGLTQADIDALLARIPADEKNKALNYYIDFQENKATDAEAMYFAKYAVQVSYEIGDGIRKSTQTPSGQAEIYMYSTDEQFFFTKSYSDHFAYYEELAETTVDFRPADNWMQFYKYPLAAPPGSPPGTPPARNNNPDLFYGFDWLRKGDSERKSPYRIYDMAYQNAYKSIGRNISTDPNSSNVTLDKKEYVRAKGLYRSIPMSWKLPNGNLFTGTDDSVYTNTEPDDLYDRDYSPAWISIPNIENYKISTLKLKMKIRSQKKATDLRLYFNAGKFKIKKIGSATGAALTVKTDENFAQSQLSYVSFAGSDIPAVTNGKKVNWIDFEFEVIAPYEKLEIFKVMAGKLLAGKMYLFPNSAENIREKKLLVVKIRHKSGDAGIGKVTDDELELLRIFSSTNNIKLTIDTTSVPEKDLIGDSTFQNYFDSPDVINDEKQVSGMRLAKYLKGLVQGYDDHVKVFFINARNEESGVGGATSQEIKTILMFNSAHETSGPHVWDLAHEYFHSLGIAHAFTDRDIQESAYLTFAKGSTNNVMDYDNDDPTALSFIQGTFFWQWGIARKNASRNS